ncbi:unnamed protein product [Medioppia subpectinata]|uniref:Uncharacterized protein n=1 Tax=Medioppia subpectinata TaxID=1979941 RepID=A0A7R9KP16_9ACAR|nr:unnamed protein product [Medioppia subpectinata]CAG2107118.1 unnamed protein product [Medioppia subpectinata]
MENRLKHGSDSKTSNARCDPSLRQVKPYFYGMNNNNKPYERPNAAPNSGNNFNYNRLQYSSQPPNQCKPVFTPNNSYTTPNSQHINQKPKPIASNGSLKSKLDFGTPLMPKANRDDSSAKEIRNPSLEKNQNYIKNSVNSETNDGLDCNSNDNSFLPKSIQRMRELTPHFVRKDPKTSSNKDVRSEPKSEEPAPEPRVKRDSISGGVGANSEVDNRDFLIDDEISDQPELTLGCNIDKKDLMKTLNSELEGLILKQESPSGPSSPSVSLSSSASTVIPSSTTFRNRKPRPLSLVEMADGSVGLDSPSFRAASQDLIGIKTLLFRLHGLLQNAETLNPFEHNYTQNKFYNQLTIAEDDNLKSIDSDDLSKENFDLKRQIVLQQQIIEDKDRTIRLLQQQMAKYSNINSAYIPQNVSVEKVNASCQTDRCANASNINPRAVSDGSNGMLVSFWISKVPAFA